MVSRKRPIFRTSQGEGPNVTKFGIDDPPEEFEQGADGWEERHDEVLAYARSLFAWLAEDTALTGMHYNASLFSQFYRGTKTQSPDKIQLSMVSANMVNATVNIKNSKFLTDRLKMTYIAQKNSDHELAEGVSRLFDWHALETYREELKSDVEMTAIIAGMSGCLILPKQRFRGNHELPTIPYPEYVDPRNLYFDPYEGKERDYTIFVIREIHKGHLLDQKYHELLESRGESHFARGYVNSLGYGDSEYGRYTRDRYSEDRVNLLKYVGDDEVEMIRVFKRDNRMIKSEVYFPFIDPQSGQIDKESDTEDAQFGRYQAGLELGMIINDGHPPEEGENHYNHLLVHETDLDNLKADFEMPDTEVTKEQIEFMESHVAMTHKLLESGDQRYDEKIFTPMFNGKWRFIKIIGDQVVEDGSLDLEFDKFPVVVFRNAKDMDTSIGISDVLNLANLNAALNSLMADILMNSHENAFPEKRKPEYMRNPEKWKEGDTIFVPEDFQGDEWEFEPIRAAVLPAQVPHALGLFQNYIEIVGGGNSTQRGEGGGPRSSGIENAQELAASNRRFSSTEILYGHSWNRYAEIVLGQMVQFLKGEEIEAIIGPEYSDVAPVIIDAIDPFATIKTLRIPADVDVENQNGQNMMQLGIMGVTHFGLPPQAVLNVLAKQGDAGIVSRMTGQFLREIEKPEVQQEMQQIQQERAEAGAAGQG